jgi:signal transduction histidine kinase
MKSIVPLAVYRPVSDSSAQRAATPAYASPAVRLPTQEVVASIVHELRNPLTLIRSEVAVARRTSDNPSIAESCELIDRQINQIVVFLRDLVALGDASSRAHVSESDERIDMRSLVRMSLDGLARVFDVRSLRIVRQGSCGDAVVAGDRSSLLAAMTVLLASTAKLAGSDGEIVVRERVENDVVEISVASLTGGISRNQLSTVFEPFVRGRLDGMAGAGVGMAVARRTIEAHGGSVRAESASDEQSTEFIVRLPRCVVP